MTARTTLIVGIGSPHGDDRVGWEMARNVERWADTVSCRVRIAKSPLEILSWLDGVERLIVCDACRSGATIGTVRRLDWPDSRLASQNWSGTHDFSIAAVLELAQQLNRLPVEVVLFAVEAGPAGPLEKMSDEVRSAIRHLAQSIAAEIADCGIVEELESCTNSH